MDDELRALERAVAAGDPAAALRLRATRLRAAMAATITTVELFDIELRRVWERVNKPPKNRYWSEVARKIGTCLTTEVGAPPALAYTRGQLRSRGGTPQSASEHRTNFISLDCMNAQVLVVREPDRVTVGVAPNAFWWKDEIPVTYPRATYEAPWFSEHYEWASRADPGRQPSAMLDRIQAPLAVAQAWAAEMGERHRAPTVVQRLEEERRVRRWRLRD